MPWGRRRLFTWPGWSRRMSGRFSRELTPMRGSIPCRGPERKSWSIASAGSSRKANAVPEEWLDVMREAHRMDLPTSATMMFGHAETLDERVEHLLQLRNLQAKSRITAGDFLNFVPWPFMDEGTVLRDELGIRNSVGIPGNISGWWPFRGSCLPNISHIQASWLTVGKTAGRSACMPERMISDRS
jgi:2-iminoacetate synthase ThiH